MNNCWEVDLCNKYCRYFGLPIYNLPLGYTGIIIIQCILYRHIGILVSGNTINATITIIIVKKPTGID